MGSCAVHTVSYPCGLTLRPRNWGLAERAQVASDKNKTHTTVLRGQLHGSWHEEQAKSQCRHSTWALVYLNNSVRGLNLLKQTTYGKTANKAQGPGCVLPRQERQGQPKALPPQEALHTMSQALRGTAQNVTGNMDQTESSETPYHGMCGLCPQNERGAVSPRWGFTLSPSTELP